MATPPKSQRERAKRRRGIYVRTRKKSGSAFGVGQVIGTLREALGSKGAGASIAEALRKVNPNFDDSITAQDAYTSNCQRCIVAYELQRRGYDVTALPTYEDDILPTIAHRYTNKEGKKELIGRWQGAFKGAKGQNIGGATEKATYDNIVNKMKDFGNGSRAVVQILYKRGGGHVFNVENVGGQITFVEAQAGQTKNIFNTLKHVNLDTIRLIRTDNLKISDRAKNFVTKYKKR